MSNKLKYYLIINKTQINLTKHKECHEFLPDYKTLREHVVAQLQEYEQKKKDYAVKAENISMESIPKFELEPMKLEVNSKYFDEILSNVCRVSNIKLDKVNYGRLYKMPVTCNIMPQVVLEISRNDKEIENESL